MTLTPDALHIVKGSLPELSDSIHAVYWVGLYGGGTIRHEAAAIAHLTRLAAAMGFRLVPVDAPEHGESK